ncbi:hypothetical protein ABPG72_005587 [Tetrahymena utriculariae]
MDKLKEYYCNQFFITFHSFQRQYVLGIILLTIQLGYYFYFLITQYTAKLIEQKDFTSFEGIANFLDVNDQHKKSSSQGLFISFLIINMCILLMIITDVIYYIWSSISRSPYEQRDNQISIIQNILSFLLKIYSYLIYAPSVLFSLYETDWIKMVNIVISIMIGFLTDIHDFDYNLNQSISIDTLSKYPLNLIQISKRFLFSILIFNRGLYNYNISSTVCLVCSAFGIIYQSYYREYHVYKIRVIQYIFVFLQAISSFFCLIIQTNLTLSISILLLVIFPITAKIALDTQKQMSSFYNRFIQLSDKIQSKNIQSQIYYIQDAISQLDKFNHFDYFQNPNSIILESIASDHIEQCIQKHCFCKEIVKGNKEKKQLKRRDHLILHIDTLFREILRSSNNLNKFHFYYINFLVEQVKSKAHTLFQIQRLKNEFPKTSILFQVYYQYLTHKIKKSFKLENNTFLGDIVGLIFEEHLRIASQMYESSLYQKLDLLSMLNNDHINTYQVQECCQKLYNSRNLLKNKITFLSKLNPNNAQLNVIKDGFNQNFCFVLSNDQINFSQQINQIQHRKMLHGTVVASSQRHNLFESDSCVLFLSAQISSLGNILKAQKSFEQMFGFPNYIGRNIHSIIPNAMIQEHQQQIKQYLYGSEKKYASTTSISCALAKNQENFAVPVNIKATIDHVSAFDQIGFACTISLNYDISNCMLIQKDTYNIQIVSKQFYHTFLQKCFDFDEITQINASKIFPQIPTLIQNLDTQQIQIKDTLMILPAFFNSSLQNLESNGNSKECFKSSPLTDKISKWTEQEIHSNNQNFNYFHVYLQIQYTKNNDFPCFVLSVKNSQKISNMYEMQPLIQQLQVEYVKFNNQTSNFDIESLNNIQQSTRIGYSELFQFNENNSVNALYQNKNSITNFQSQLKNFQKQKTLFQENINNKVEDIISPKVEQKENSYLNISKRTHVSLIQSPQNTNQEISHLICQDMPSTYRQTDREHGQISSRQNLDASKNFTPKCFDEDLLQRSERKQIKQLPEKFWKSPNIAAKSNEKTLNKQNKLSRDIIKRLQAFHEGKINESARIKKDLDNTQIPPSPNIRSDLNSVSNNLGQTIIKNSITSFHQNNLILENQKNFQNKKKAIDLNHQASQQIDQQEFYDQILSEKQQNQESSSPKVRFQDNQSNNSNQADNGIKKNYQQSSLVSSSNSTKEALKQVERKIMTTQSCLGLRLLNLFGLVSVISISLAIILQGLQITLAFERAQIDFNFVSWPMDIASSMSQIQIYITQYYMVLFQLIPGLTKKWTTVKAECLGNIKILNDEWTNLWIAQINSSQQYTPYFYDTYNRETDWSVNRDVKSQKDSLFNLRSSQFYFVQNYLTAYKTYPLLQSDSYNQQAILINNYQQYFEQANQVKEDIESTSITSLKSITSNSALLMYLCISLSMCMLILVFPIYAYLQFQNEQIYRLMATLNANSIIQMSKQAVSSLSNFQFALQQYKDIQKLTGSVSQKQSKQNGAEKDIHLQTQLPTFTDNQKQLILKNLEKPNKKKTISTSQPLSKFSFCMLLMSIIIFAFIIILPVVAYFLVNNFQEEAILNVKVLSSLYDLKNSFSYSYYLTLGNIYYSLNSQQLYKGYFFAQRIPAFFNENQEKLSDVLQIVSESSARKRYDDSDYQKFFYEILKHDVCQPISNYPQFVNQNQYNLSINQCTSLRGGILTKGYQTAAKFFFDSLQSVNDLIALNKNKDIKKILRGWERQFDIPNFNIYFRMTIDILSVLKDFMKGKGDKYLSQMQTTEKLVSIFEIIILFLLFIFWQVFFYRKMQKEINENRRFLSLLDVQVVVENTYMLTYLSKIKIL